MSTQEREFIKELKLLIIRGIISLIGVVVIGATAFYYTTTNRLGNLEEKTQTLTVNKADKAIMEVQLSNINQSLIEIKQKLNSNNQ